MTRDDLSRRLSAQPRVRLAALPTPLDDATRLRLALGGPSRCPRILVKRDDLTGLGLGGNKVRGLEFLLADALARGCDTLVTGGGPGSNWAMLAALAARTRGLDTVLVLTGVSQPGDTEKFPYRPTRIIESVATLADELTA